MILCCGEAPIDVLSRKHCRRACVHPLCYDDRAGHARRAGRTCFGLFTDLLGQHIMRALAETKAGTHYAHFAARPTHPTQASPILAISSNGTVNLTLRRQDLGDGLVRQRGSVQFGTTLPWLRLAVRDWVVNGNKPLKVPR